VKQAQDGDIVAAHLVSNFILFHKYAPNLAIAKSRQSLAESWLLRNSLGAAHNEFHVSRRGPDIDRLRTSTNEGLASS
jgi:hypothetical protein